MLTANPTHPRGRAPRWAAAGIGLAAACAGIVGAALPGRSDAALERPGRQAPAGCIAVEIQRGDTVWAIAKANGLTLDEIGRLNPQIGNLALVHPGDQIAVTCDPQGVALAPATSVTRAVDVTRWLDEREPDGNLTWRATVAHLYAAGFRGDDLVTVAAIAPGESGRNPRAVGDVTIANNKWGPSVGVWQIRTLRAATGTGAPRDIEALDDVAHQAWAAYEIWRGQGFKAWTAWQKGWHVGHVATARAAAAEIGVL